MRGLLKMIVNSIIFILPDVHMRQEIKWINHDGPAAMGVHIGPLPPTHSSLDIEPVEIT